jgi:hypothetical protein
MDADSTSPALVGMIDVSPDVHFVNSMRNRNLGWRKALAEMIDNALDAQANQVKIVSKNRTLQVIDDGNGVKDLASTVTSGKHIPSDSTELGMYGVGLKDAWHWAGTRMEVETVRDGRKGSLVADSNEMIRLGRWQIPPPQYSESNAPNGTTVTLHLSNASPKRNAPSESNYHELAWVFTPALLEGRQIMVPAGKKVKPLKPIVLPTLSNALHETFLVEGKEVTINIGIVPDGQRMTNGPFWIQYGHRNIAKSTVGCGSFSTDRIGGIVKLGKGWLLSANKDDLTDYRDELNAEIFDRIKMLLERAEQLTQDVANDMLQSELESQLNEALSKAKKTEREQRPGGSRQIGSIAPVGTGKKRRRAVVSNPDEEGSVESLGEADQGTPRRKRGTHLAFSDLDDNTTLGEYDPLSNRVTLNRIHPFIEKAREAKNVVALHAVAFSLICHWAVNNRGDQKLLFESDDFTHCFGKVLSSLSFTEENANGKAAV